MLQRTNGIASKAVHSCRDGDIDGRTYGPECRLKLRGVQHKGFFEFVSHLHQLANVRIEDAKARKAAFGTEQMATRWPT